MANLADCAVAIAKSDLNKLNGAVKRLNEKLNGVEYKQTWKIKNGKETKKVMWYHYSLYGGLDNAKDEDYYEVDGEKMSGKEYDERYSYKNGWQTDYDTHKTKIERYFNNGWSVDFSKLGTYSYQSDAWVQEHSDHITVHFGGRWGFPVGLDEFLNSRDILWQGAVAEDGCEVYDETLGTTDFGLRITEEKEGDEDYFYHYVEDTSTD